MPKLHQTADPTIRALWRMGFDTIEITKFFNDRKQIFSNGSQRLKHDEFFTEADVYNALDRSRAWTNQRIVKAR